MEGKILFQTYCVLSSLCSVGGLLSFLLNVKNDYFYEAIIKLAICLESTVYQRHIRLYILLRLPWWGGVMILILQVRNQKLLWIRQIFWVINKQQTQTSLSLNPCSQIFYPFSYRLLMRSQYEIITQSFNCTFVCKLVIMCPHQHTCLADRHEPKTQLRQHSTPGFALCSKNMPPNLAMFSLHWKVSRTYCLK